jgi:hypothetical protein
MQYDWESVARFVVGAFRVDVARAGAAAEVGALVDELCRLSPQFDALPIRPIEIMCLFPDRVVAETRALLSTIPAMGACRSGAGR